jgi:hypothetical protein
MLPNKLKIRLLLAQVNKGRLEVSHGKLANHTISHWGNSRDIPR